MLWLSLKGTVNLQKKKPRHLQLKFYYKTKRKYFQKIIQCVTFCSLWHISQEIDLKTDGQTRQTDIHTHTYVYKVLQGKKKR